MCQSNIVRSHELCVPSEDLTYCIECGKTASRIKEEGCDGYLQKGYVPPNAMSIPERAMYNTSALDTQVGGGHYKDMKIQPVEFIVANNIPYREANVIKYTARHKSKNGIEDIKKAIHYLEMIMEDYNVN